MADRARKPSGRFPALRALSYAIALSMVHGQLSRDVGLFLLLGAGAGVAASATRSQGDATWKPGFRSWRLPS